MFENRYLLIPWLVLHGLSFAFGLVTFIFLPAGPVKAALGNPLEQPILLGLMVGKCDIDFFKFRHW